MEQLSASTGKSIGGAHVRTRETEKRGETRKAVGVHVENRGSLGMESPKMDEQEPAAGASTGEGNGDGGMKGNPDEIQLDSD